MSEFRVMQVWNPFVSVPGTSLHSVHQDVNEAWEEARRADAADALLSRPRMSKADARKIAVESYGEPAGNRSMAGTIHDATTGLMYRPRHRYDVYEVYGTEWKMIGSV